MLCGDAGGAGRKVARWETRAGAAGGTAFFGREGTSAQDRTGQDKNERKKVIGDESIRVK